MILPLKTRATALRRQAGFTIIEVMVAMFVLLLGVLATTTLLNTANAETDRNQARNGATNLVRDIIEASRALPYSQVNPTKDSGGVADDTLETALKTMAPVSGGSSFADSDTAATGWQITRRGVTYTITLQACVVDDAKDGIATNHGTPSADGSGYYCPDLPSSSATADPDGDDYRRVKVTAAWTSNSCNGCGVANQTASPKTYSVAQTAVIVNPSGGLGPAAIGPPTTSGFTDCRTKTFNQVYPAQTVAVTFKVGDPFNTSSNQTTPTSTDPATGNKTFTYTYTGTGPNSAVVPDGQYDLTIQGIDRSGRGGPFTTVNLYINCHEPPNVQNVRGGFDWRRCGNYPVLCAPGDRVFDLDWNRVTPDQDIVGYYVYRVQGNGPDFDLSLNESDDQKVACASRALQPPTDTTTIPGDVDFLEPFTPQCFDTGVAAVPNLLSSFPNPLTVLANQTLAGATGTYWIQAVDNAPTNDPTIPPSGLRTALTGLSNHSNPAFTVIENELNTRPTTPTTLRIRNVAGQPCLSWPDSVDLNLLGGQISGGIRFYRIYRDSNLVASVNVTVNGLGGSSVSVQAPDVPYKDRIGRTDPDVSNSCDVANNTDSWFLDKTAPSSAHYWVTAVDQDYLESFPTVNADWP